MAKQRPSGKSQRKPASPGRDESAGGRATSGADLLEIKAREHWNAHYAPLLEASDASPLATPLVVLAPRPKHSRRLTPRQLTGIWTRSQKELTRSRGSWRRLAMFFSVQSGPPFDSFIRAVGMIEGTPADYSLSPQETLGVVAMNPGAIHMAGPYLLMAWHRLLMSDDSASWPVPLDTDMTHAAALFQTRKEALAFINLIVLLGSSLQFSVHEPPLRSAARSDGRPRRFPPGAVARLYDEFCSLAKRAQKEYREGQRAPETVRFAGVRSRSRKSRWVAIWQHGWPRAWALEVLSIVLDEKKDYLEKNL